MNYLENVDIKTLQQKLKRASADVSQLEEKVSAVMRDVRVRGDAAVREYTQKFDGVQLTEFSVDSFQLENAQKNVSEELKTAIQLAKSNIEKFHALQKSAVVEIETMPGVKCWRKNIPIEKVGLYIPGGSAPLFSTILMLVVPAKLAGCKEIILCTPPSKDGNVNPAILYTAQLCGVTKIFKVGGAQAIAAMAYGMESIPKADKIFGPGNSFVTCAKQLIAKEGMAIDIPAGPSELAVFADASVPASFIAADLLSQSEHGPDSQVVVVSTSKNVLDNVMKEVEKQVEALPRQEIAKKSLANSFAILAKNETEAMDLLNDYAPEHLILACENAEELSGRVVNAGSVFLGAWSPESVGDYASGTNHTLPTNGFARAWSGVSLDSFVKKVTFQQLTKEGLQNIGPSVELMAEAEGLFAHKNAVTIRINNV
ncbi:MAG TPA: histidinol dehydrogenase [Bacteroidia bacterium]|jgi:histidinol dehydrogenase|nr:histidinol dehydrogenase [Bacteroidia bacterium]